MPLRQVALHVRAWVEIMNAAFHIDGEFVVALHVRAWVEIVRFVCFHRFVESPSM